MKTALITGISSGIGRATALELGRRGYHVVGAGRSHERGDPVVADIIAEGGSAEFLSLDLASLESTRQAARTFVESGRTLDVLINNAGVGVGRGITADGFEIHFGVNHLGHFALTHHIRESLPEGGRVVSVTSAAHFNASGIDFDAVRRRTRTLLGWREYGVSKLANVLFTRHLARLAPGWRTYAVHPGMTDTGIIPWWVRPFLSGRLFTPGQGADTVIWCATSPDVSDESGLYYRRRESRPPSDPAQNDDLGADLWHRSEVWCDVGIET